MQQNPVPQPKTAAPKPPRNRPAAVVYLKGIGGGLSIAGAVALIPLHYYWWGVAGIYLGLFTLAADVLFETWKPLFRFLVCVFWLTAAALFSRYIVQFEREVKPMLSSLGEEGQTKVKEKINAANAIAKSLPEIELKMAEYLDFHEI